MSGLEDFVVPCFVASCYKKPMTMNKTTHDSSNAEQYNDRATQLKCSPLLPHEGTGSRHIVSIELQGTRQEVEQTSIHHNAPDPSITTMRHEKARPTLSTSTTHKYQTYRYQLDIPSHTEKQRVQNTCAHPSDLPKSSKPIDLKPNTTTHLTNPHNVSLPTNPLHLRLHLTPTNLHRLPSRPLPWSLHRPEPKAYGPPLCSLRPPLPIPTSRTPIR